MVTYLEKLRFVPDGVYVGTYYYAYKRPGVVLVGRKRKRQHVETIDRSFTLDETHGTMHMSSDMSLIGVRLMFTFIDCQRCDPRTKIRILFDPRAQLAMSRWQKQFGFWHRVHVHGNHLIQLELVFKTPEDVYATVLTTIANDFDNAETFVAWLIDRWARTPYRILDASTPDA